MEEAQGLDPDECMSSDVGWLWVITMGSRPVNSSTMCGGGFGKLLV
jgi:hypothetical protein